MRRDLFRSAVRQLVRAPRLSAVVILTLALGTGANAAVFGLLDALVLRPLPVHEPDRLVQIAAYDRDGRPTGITVAAVSALAARQTVLTDLCACSPGSATAEVNGTVTRVVANAVTGSYLSVLGAPPAIGRGISDDDLGWPRGAPAPVVVLGHAFWQRHYGGDPGVLGRVLRIEGLPFTIIGVTPPGFFGVRVGLADDVTIPITWLPSLLRLPLEPGQFPVAQPLGRLRDGVTIAQARAQLQRAWPAAWQAVDPAARPARPVDDGIAPRLVVEAAATGSSPLRLRVARPLTVVLTLTGGLLLIACLNLAGLGVARAADRAPEIGIRLALGASRRQVVAQLVTESLLLSVIGTVVGLPLACWGGQALASLLWTGAAPLVLDLTPDWRMVSFLAVMACVTGTLVGVVPAWTVSRSDLACRLRSAGGVTRVAGRRADALLVAQIALSVVCLAAALLFLRSLAHLSAFTPGFRADGVVLAHLAPQPGGYDTLDDARYYPTLLERLSALPGIEAAAMMRSAPASERDITQRVQALDVAEGTVVPAAVELISPGYFQTLGIAMRRGRDFTWRDDGARGRVAIVTRSLAHDLYPNTDPLGRHLRLGEGPAGERHTIIAIVEDTSVLNVRVPQPRMVFVPWGQAPDRWPVLAVSAEGGFAGHAESVRRTVASLGHEYVVESLTLNQQIARALSRERALAGGGTVMGVLAMLLVGLGVHGLMAHRTARRTRELAVRRALGATPDAVRRLVGRHAARLVVAGLALGVSGALIVAPFLASHVYGVAPRDPISLVVACALVFVVGVLAARRPASRAARVNPVEALRAE